MIRDNPIFWLAAIAVWVVLLTFALLEVFAVTGQAVTLQITGQSSGAGLHTLHVIGDSINVSILQGNNSIWLINATGASA